MSYTKKQLLELFLENLNKKHLRCNLYPHSLDRKCSNSAVGGSFEERKENLEDVFDETQVSWLCQQGAGSSGFLPRVSIS